MPDLEIVSHRNQIDIYPNDLVIKPGFNRVDGTLVKEAMDATPQFGKRVDDHEYEVRRLQVAVSKKKSGKGKGSD